MKHNDMIKQLDRALEDMAPRIGRTVSRAQGKRLLTLVAQRATAHGYAVRDCRAAITECDGWQSLAFIAHVVRGDEVATLFVDTDFGTADAVDGDHGWRFWS